MSESHKGHFFTKEHKQNLSKSIKNSITEEEKIKRNERMKGNNNLMYGKTHSDEARTKICKAASKQRGPRGPYKKKK